MADPTPFALNSFGVKTVPIDYTQPGTPTLQSYHGGTIVVNSKIIGRIDEWNPAGAYNRDGSHVYELNINTFGKPVDYIPGVARNFNVTFTRGEVWDQELEIALGYPAVWQDLTDQNFPFTAQEMLFKGASIYRTWSYFGCWFTEKNLASGWSAEGDAKIKVNSNMAYVARKNTT